MQSARKIVTSNYAFCLSAFALACLLLVQTSSLHMHNHELSSDGSSSPIHVTGVDQHASTHDEPGEIDLSLDGLLLKLQIGDFVAGLLFVVMALVIIGDPHRYKIPRLAPRRRINLFDLLPPAHAPPQ